MQYTHVEQGGYTITPETKEKDEAALKKYVGILYASDSPTKKQGGVLELTALKRENPARYAMFEEWSREVEAYAERVKASGKVCRVTPDNFEELRKKAINFRPYGG